LDGEIQPSKSTQRKRKPKQWCLESPLFTTERMSSRYHHKSAPEFRLEKKPF
jgi:hypothetical protein